MTNPPAEAGPPEATEPQTQEPDYKALYEQQKALADKNSTAATKLAEIEEAQKTETQKQSEALAKLKAENERLATVELKRSVADAKGLPSSLAKNLVGSTQAELESSADELLAILRSTEESPKPTYPVVSGEGKSPKGGGSTGEQFAAFIESKLKR